MLNFSAQKWASARTMYKSGDAVGDVSGNGVRLRCVKFLIPLVSNILFVYQERQMEKGMGIESCYKWK